MCAWRNGHLACWDIEVTLGDDHVSEDRVSLYRTKGHEAVHELNQSIKAINLKDFHERFETKDPRKSHHFMDKRVASDLTPSR